MCQILFSAPEDKQREKGNLPGGVGVLGEMDNKKHNKQASRQAGSWKVLLNGGGGQAGHRTGKSELLGWRWGGIKRHGQRGITEAGSEVARFSGPASERKPAKHPEGKGYRDPNHWTPLD